MCKRSCVFNSVHFYVVGEVRYETFFIVGLNFKIGKHYQRERERERERERIVQRDKSITGVRFKPTIITDQKYYEKVV